MPTSRWMLLSLSTAAALVAAACSDDGAGPDPDSRVCTPATCQSAGKDCGSMPDGCGQAIACGACSGGQTCGGGGVANVCAAGSCTPTTCAAMGKDCGLVSDGCGDVLSCGACAAPKSCSAGGTANVCGVWPDAGAKQDQGTSSGVCDPTCMAQSGAVCCTGCGCSGSVKCTPVCESPTKWDCEMRCCFDYGGKACK